ncbi:hypothetical protein B0H19DRAFT_1083568 [Mycena capillaripes]|nr:hypothetical protein B0H19DRAFT_1083568 [Mycena capillaripes]
MSHEVTLKVMKKVPSTHFVNTVESEPTTARILRSFGSDSLRDAVNVRVQWFTMHETRAIVIPIQLPSHWICCFVDFDNNYLAIFNSWKHSAIPKNWKESVHAHIFKLIQEFWLHRLFLELESAIDWTEWVLDACPELQFQDISLTWLDDIESGISRIK